MVWRGPVSGFFLKHNKFSLDFLSRKVWGSALSFILWCCFEATQPKLEISKKFLQNGQNVLCFVCSVNVHLGKTSEGGRQRRMLSSLSFISWTRSPSRSHWAWWESHGIAGWSQLWERAPGTCSQRKAPGTNKDQCWVWLIPGIMLISKKYQCNYWFMKSLSSWKVEESDWFLKNLIKMSHKIWNANGKTWLIKTRYFKVL